ncbi:uncharacterized protein METZ01_LOCUS219627 [marine metagenome]|uniref:Uncharacterized protein n=1 Tax=marine metagenome TaxID=408172 RepID=A0A382FWY3_9ZZZZ
MKETEQTQIEQYKYMLEVGHSKSGSNHVLIIKRLRVSDDDLATALSALQAALSAFREMDLS